MHVDQSHHQMGEMSPTTRTKKPKKGRRRQVAFLTDVYFILYLIRSLSPAPRILSF